MEKTLKPLRDALLADYYKFFKFFWPLISSDEYIDAPHVKLICNELQTVGQHIIKREKPPHDWYIINVPPGTSKSSIVTVLWPAWLLTNDDSIFIISSSYSKGLSERDVRKSKAVMINPAYQAIFKPLKLVKDTESYFETDRSGGRYATSTGGTIVGYHANVNIHDDPLSVEMSYSPADRTRANRFITETMSQRVRKKGITPQLIIMQRLHEEDPTGYILSKGLNVKHIALPAVLSNITTHPEIYAGKLLDPRRLSMEVITQEKKKLGDVAFSCQYEQDPTSKESLLYSDFKTYEELPPTFGNGNYTDTADTGDDYLCSVSYRKGKDCIYVTDVIYSQEPMDITEKTIPLMFERSDTRYSRIESNAGGRFFAYKVRYRMKGRTKVDWFHQSKNKESRILTNAHSVTESIIMPIDWKERWPMFYEHLRGYRRLFSANKFHDAPDVLTGIIEKEIFQNKQKLIRIS